MGPSRQCTRINKRLLPVKCHYFLFMAALACALPFRTIFAKQLGISATAVGVIFCIVPFLKTITNPLFGFVLDYFKKFRLTLSVIITFVALSHVAMILIPSRITLTHNLNITDFHLKMRYSCAKEISSHDYDHRLMLYSKYILTNRFESGRSNFICDVLCSNDFTNISESQNTIDRHQCHDKMSFDIKVRIEISKCDMNVSLESGKIFIMSENVQNLTIATINESSVTQFKTWRIPAENCSAYSFTEKKEKKKLSESDILEDENISAVSKQYLFTTIPGLINVEDGETLYEEQMYNIKILDEKYFLNSSCRSDFFCKTKKCYSDMQIGGSDLERFVDHENEFLTVQFWGFFFLMSVSSVMLSSVIFLMDAVCYELLQENRDDYGLQRLWGTIGWGIGALAGGYINQIVSAESGEIDYAPSFCLLAFLSLVDLIPMYNLKVTELKYSSHIWKDVCFLFTKLSIVYNAIIVYSVGALSGFIWNYQFWFMEEIGSSQILLGLSQTLECVFELPWFIVSGWIIKKLGHDQCNNITFLCFGLRYLCFVFMYNPWWTLAAGLFHGPTFGLFYASMTMYAKDKAPPGTEATVQSILHFFFEGIGIATGSFLGGVGLDKFGSRISFLYAATISFVLLIINLFMGFLFSRSYLISKKTSEIGCL